MPNGDLLVLERITLSTKIYRCALGSAHAIPIAMSQPETRPTLEQMSRKDMMAAGIAILEKTLAFSSDDHSEVPADLEGMIFLPSGQLILSNDSDFGIEGAETQFWRIELSEVGA